MPVDSGAAGQRGSRIFSLLRKIAGMPDYFAYTEHLRRCHPQLPIPSERQFFEDFVRSRYGDSATRCC
jgi:uncharacterized short protein YbdD (DUF466 family)